MKLATRIFGAINIVASLLAFYYSAWEISIHWGRQWPGNPNSGEWAVFFAIKAVSVLLIACVAYFGVRLMLCDFRALWQTTVIFILEAVFWFVHFYVTWMAMPISKVDISVGLWGIAIAEVDAQVLSGYVLFGIAIAAVLLLIQRRRSKSLKPLAQ